MKTNRWMGTVAGILVAVLMSTPAFALKVNARVLNVRRGPGFHYAVIGTLSKGTAVTRIARSGAWSKISRPRVGWVYSTYLSSAHHRATTSSSVSGSAATWKTWPRPPADYRIMWFRGVRLNKRTIVMIERAEKIMRALGGPSRYSLSQGSYHYGVSASAGTHNGGGAVDVRCSYYSTRTADTKLVKALRMAGFAAWRRGYFCGLPPHIHCIAIGDRQASWAAKSQVYAYFRGRDGLAGYRRDIHLYYYGHNIGRPVPNWAR